MAGAVVVVLRRPVHVAAIVIIAAVIWRLTVVPIVPVVVSIIVAIVAILRVRVTGTVPAILRVPPRSDRICCGAYHGSLTSNYTDVSYRLCAVDILRIRYELLLGYRRNMRDEWIVVR